MTGLDQDMMQEEPELRHAARLHRKNIMLTACCQTVVILLFLVLGVFLYAYAARAGLALPRPHRRGVPARGRARGLPAVVGLLFVVGLVSGHVVGRGVGPHGAHDLLLHGRYTGGCAALRRARPHAQVRHGVHLALAAAMTLVILCFDAFADDSVINLVYKVASYTYGPLLGMFAFGMCTPAPGARTPDSRRGPWPRPAERPAAIRAAAGALQAIE